MTLHPQNARIGTAGIPFPPQPAPRRPAVYVADGSDTKHNTPLCPELSGPYRALGREDALYAHGDRWCETCRMYKMEIDGSGWTDPRYRTDDDS